MKPSKQKKNYRSEIVDSLLPIQKRICVAIPYTGVVRVEWMKARYGQVIPVNWSVAELAQYVDTFSPLHYSVEDARNISVDYVVREGFEWLLFIDHDVVIPPDTFIKINNYMGEGDIPVVSGLYNAKGNPPEPLLFRGRGNSWYRNWKAGDKVWVDGIPMGCTLISGKLLAAMSEASEEYMAGGLRVRRVFHTPQKVRFDSQTGAYSAFGGTEDLWWCDRVIKEKWLHKTGFKKVASKKYPFLVDTSINCGHIDLNGRIY